MRLPLTLSVYIGRQFLTAVLLTLAIMIIIIGSTYMLATGRVLRFSRRKLAFTPAAGA